jgi:hypothetical protein
MSKEFDIWWDMACANRETVDLKQRDFTELAFMAGQAIAADKIAELERKLGIAREALQWSKEMLAARDEMNSKVHCAPVRWSPITERVFLALKELDAKEFLREGEKGEL